jgi:hypothetical protein
MLYYFHWIVVAVAFVIVIIINIHDIISITMIDTATSRWVMDIVTVNFRHDVGDSNVVGYKISRSTAYSSSSGSSSGSSR